MFENGTNIKRLVLFQQQAASAAEPQTHEERLRGDVHAETSGSETGMIQNNKRLQSSCLFSLQTILTSPILSRLLLRNFPSVPCRQRISASLPGPAWPQHKVQGTPRFLNNVEHTFHALTFHSEISLPSSCPTETQYFLYFGGHFLLKAPFSRRGCRGFSPPCNDQAVPVDSVSVTMSIPQY